MRFVSHIMSLAAPVYWWITNGSLALTSLQTSICNCLLDIFHQALKTQSSYKQTHYLSLQNVSFYPPYTLGSHSILKPLLKSAILPSLLFFVIVFNHQLTNWPSACKKGSLLSNRILPFLLPHHLHFIVPSHSVSNLWNTVHPHSSLTIVTHFQGSQMVPSASFYFPNHYTVAGRTNVVCLVGSTFNPSIWISWMNYLCFLSIFIGCISS